MQVRPQIIVTGVSNLTDARYFAAMGVQWMGFPLTGETALNATQVMAIKDWVEVPKYFVEIAPDQQHDIADIIGILEIDAVVTELLPKAVSQEVIWRRKIRTEELSAPTLPGHMEQVILLDMTAEEDAQKMILEDEKLTSALGAICAGHRIWLAMDWTPESLPEFIEKVRPAGVVLEAGDEEIIGVKSYTGLDRIFSILEP
jgi:phosphoribosylanthranilate isomerase